MKYARASTQLSLLTVAPRYRVELSGQSRNAYGSAAQEIVCAALGLLPIPINGMCECCFDAEKGNDFYEVKSVYRFSKVVCYDWRLAKEERAAYEGKQLYYAILIHGLRGEKDGEEIIPRMAEGSKILVVRAEVIRALAKSETLQKIKSVETISGSRNGYQRKGYKEGYRNLPVNRIIETTSAIIEHSFKLYDKIYRTSILT